MLCYNATIMSYFRDHSQLTKYILDNYPEVTDRRIDEGHWDLFAMTATKHVVFRS